MLESQRDRQNGADGRAASAQKELPLFASPARPEPATDELRAAVQAINPDELSPKAALEALYRLRKLLD